MKTKWCNLQFELICIFTAQVKIFSKPEIFRRKHKFDRKFEIGSLVRCIYSFDLNEYLSEQEAPSSTLPLAHRFSVSLTTDAKIVFHSNDSEF